jgi:hypothetical protein
MQAGDTLPRIGEGDGGQRSIPHGGEQAAETVSVPFARLGAEVPRVAICEVLLHSLTDDRTGSIDCERNTERHETPLLVPWRSQDFLSLRGAQRLRSGQT